jgi:two-component SAPR family response regulator
LIDTLWPEGDGDAARFALTSAIHRLRRLLGREEAIIRKDNEVSLDQRYCWVDTWACERLLSRAESATRNNGYEPLREETIRIIQRALELYKGSFLGNDPDAPRVTVLADRLRQRLLRQLVRMGQYWERTEAIEQAAEVYEDAMRVDPCAEDVCQRLMSTYHLLGRPALYCRYY